MKYFNHISSLSDLKKQFRSLVMANHPDKGGSTETMQKINSEFGDLYEIWKLKKEMVTNTGYDNDYSGATAKEYTEHVYNEYAWKGSHYDSSLCNSDLVVIFRQWLKKTYPACKFTVNQNGWNSINIHIMKMNFNPFVINEIPLRYNVNGNLEKNDQLNDRAKNILSNIKQFMLSYNYDNSDSMRDYFDRGFYESMEFGSNTTPFTVEIPRNLRTGGECSPAFKRPQGPAHRALKKALGKAYFKQQEFNRLGNIVVLGEDHIYGNESEFYPLSYSGRKTAEKRISKLRESGIICELVNCYIKFIGYNSETEKALAKEDREAVAAERAWNEKQQTNNEKLASKNKPYVASEISQVLQPEEKTDIVIDNRAYQAFVDCVFKRYSRIGYADTRKYIKNYFKKHRANIQQIRYVVFLLSELKYRFGDVTTAA